MQPTIFEDVVMTDFDQDDDNDSVHDHRDDDDSIHHHGHYIDLESDHDSEPESESVTDMDISIEERQLIRDQPPRPPCRHGFYSRPVTPELEKEKSFIPRRVASFKLPSSVSLSSLKSLSTKLKLPEFKNMKSPVKFSDITKWKSPVKLLSTKRKDGPLKLDRLSTIYTSRKTGRSSIPRPAETEFTLNFKIRSVASLIPPSIEQAIMSFMWHERPKRINTMKVSMIRHRVTAILNLPRVAFSAGEWKRKFRVLIDEEIERQNARPEIIEKWLQRKLKEHRPMRPSTPPQKCIQPAAPVANTPTSPERPSQFSRLRTSVSDHFRSNVPGLKSLICDIENP